MIIVNGKSYASLDELPPDVRQQYEQAMGVLADQNQNGVPDVFEGMLNTGSAQTITSTSSQFIVDGKTYSSVDELPPEARQKYEQALPKINQAMSDANQNGVPDIFENQAAAQPPTRSTYAATTASPPLFEEPPTSNFDATPQYRTTLILAVIVIVVLIVMLAVVIWMAALK